MKQRSVLRCQSWRPMSSMWARLVSHVSTPMWSCLLWQKSLAGCHDNCCYTEETPNSYFSVWLVQKNDWAYVSSSGHAAHKHKMQNIRITKAYLLIFFGFILTCVQMEKHLLVYVGTYCTTRSDMSLDSKINVFTDNKSGRMFQHLLYGWNLFSLWQTTKYCL